MLLEKELEKKEIREGLIHACDVIDLIIAILRGSKNLADAKACLIHGDTSKVRLRTEELEEEAKRLCFTEKQATAILEMRLQKLIGLELQALQKEYRESLKKIAEYQHILRSRKNMDTMIRKDLDNIKKEFAVPRRTCIEDGQEAVYIEEPAAVLEAAFVMDRFGYCKLLDKSVYEKNKETVDADYPHVIRCQTSDKICLFTEEGLLHQLKAQDIPFGKMKDKGTPIDNLCKFDGSKEHLVLVTSTNQIQGKMLLFATAQAMVKLVPASEFETNNRAVAATKMAEGDRVVNVLLIENETEGVLRTTNGVFLRFALEEIPVMKKGAKGVRGIKLGNKEELEAFYLMGEDTVITYKEKEFHLSRIKLSKRDAKGKKPRVQ